jgi:hypothetical protein
MALTRLGLNQSINLASNVTGALPVANGGTALTSGFINGVANPGKILKIQSSAPTSDSNTTSATFSTYHTDGYNPVASNSTLFVQLSYCYQIYGNGSTANGTGSIRISSTESGTTQRARQSMQQNGFGGSNTYYNESSGSISAFWQPGTSSVFDILIQIATLGSGRLKMLADESGNVEKAVRMTIFEIGA